MHRIGRIQSVRTAGNKLLFLDLKQGDHTLQIVCKKDQFDRLTSFEPHTESHPTTQDKQTFKTFTRIVRKGDWYSVLGHPHRSQTGELSLLASEIPTLLSPSLHQIPSVLDDAETRSKNRHVDMLVHPETTINTLRIRHTIENYINNHFTSAGFTKVSTPILSSNAGGAIARPFETEATELEGQKLHLRIAPELWLKRLVVGGLEKVYEIGPVFRNEGVDATHNPEFSTCEFYEAFATLEDLIKRTERLMRGMAEEVEKMGFVASDAGTDTTQMQVDFKPPFQRLEFIPTIEHSLGHALPDLSSGPETAQDSLLTLFHANDIDVPANPTLPRLLDALSAHFIEPLCTSPTFITHHPAALSPLSKHTTCPITGQTVALRAELFIKGREYANMYEEENSPFAQRRKFTEQLKFREVDGEVDGESDGRREVDESYLEALEWGLPPTGGWGCGIDRLVMLFSGRERIADVLSFGSLRNVCGLGSGRK